MKANGVISRFLLFATLFLFSSTPAEAQGYAIDYVSCSTAQQIFMEDQLLRATTIGKFVSLNLGDNLRQAQGWYLKGWIMNFVTLLMGDAQDAAGSNDVVLYCDADRLSNPSGRRIYDPDSARATGNPAIIPDPDKTITGCKGDSFNPGDPVYVFWQLPGDAARVTFCQWFFDTALGSAVPSTTIFADTRRIEEVHDRVVTWPLNWGPWGYGLPVPNIQNFQLFDAMMISALTHTTAAGSRQPSSYRGAAKYANVVSAATDPATRYQSGAFMYLFLVIYASQSGITLNNDRSFGINRSPTYLGQDWGDPSQYWARSWTAPYASS